MEESSELSITYERLFELLRREKEAGEIQQLDNTFYADVVKYLGEKQRILDEASHKTDLFSAAERENTSLQLKNVKRIIKELYDRRESKILSLAMNKSRTDSDIINANNLLPEEKAMYGQLMQSLTAFRKGVYEHLIEIRLPFIPGVEIPAATQTHAKTISERQEAMAEMAPAGDLVAKPTVAPSQEEHVTVAPPSTLSENMTIKFLEETTKFVGKELEIYGPYFPGDVGTLPTDIAKVLITRGSAQQV